MTMWSKGGACTVKGTWAKSESPLTSLFFTSYIQAIKSCWFKYVTRT